MQGSSKELRGASSFQLLHWLAAGQITSEQLTACYQAAIAAENPQLNAYIALNEEAIATARASDQRRQWDRIIGRLDGLPVAIKDNIDIAGLPTTAGLPGRTQTMKQDAAVVERLRAAGAVILGKTNLDEGALGTATNNPHYGPTHNPHRHGYIAGGSSGGSAVAVAAGLCAFAIGSDTMGSIRIPASHCGVFGLKPTHGEISTRGLTQGVRRLDCIGILARSVQDLAVVLQVLDTHDPADPRSRRRRVPLAVPDWEPGRLKSGFLTNLTDLGVTTEVQAVFAQALATLDGELGERHNVDFSDYDFTRMRRAALLMMESELAIELKDDLANLTHPISPRLRQMLEYAQGKSAVDYVIADRLIDQAVLKARRLFAHVDVLILPTMPHEAYLLSEQERASDADLTSFASFTGCPAISIPMGRLSNKLPVGLQLVGAPGSDLRLLELAEVFAATLDTTPDYPVM